MIENFTFLHFFTAACIVELVFLYLFRFTYSPFTGIAINNWYTNLRWTAVILDILSVLIGFYISKFIYEYLVKYNYLTKTNELLKFLAIVICVQVIHDFSFYFLVIKQSKLGNSIVMDEFIRYAKSVKYGAVIGDSTMYLLATPLLFYISKFRNDVNIFSSLVSLYLIGYFIYQKPLLQK